MATRFVGLMVRIPPGHAVLSVWDAVSCQIEVCATGRSLVQSPPIECGVSVSDRET